jgi:hypothetical protein
MVFRIIPGVETALEGIVCNEGLLERMEAAVLG